MLETKCLNGPFPSRMSNVCTSCTGTVRKHDMIYFYKNRRTDAEIKSNVPAKGAIVLHKDCLMDFVGNSKDVKWEFSQNTPNVPHVPSNGDNNGDGEYLMEKFAEVPPMPVQAQPIQVQSSVQTNDLLGLIASSVLPLVQSQLVNKLDEVQVTSIVNNALKSALRDMDRPLRVEVVTPLQSEPVDLGVQHFMFPELLQASQARLQDGLHLNIWIAGPAGSGKSKAGEYVAKALARNFSYMGSINESHKVFGFVSPIDHTYHRTPFRDVYENGGVFMFDDFDGSDPVCAVELLGMLANGHAAFPDGMVSRHKDCLILVSANTWGHGATGDYVGRLKQDKALLNRFIMIDWDYDEVLECATSGNQTWAKRVQRIRNNVKVKGLKVLVTPRATYQGAALLRTGMSQDKVERLVIGNCLSNEQWEMVK